jgi:hypothetical protein
VGKGGHIRTVPVPDWVKKRMDEWTRASETRSGSLFRSINKSGIVWGNGVTEKVIWYVVRNFAAARSKPWFPGMRIYRKSTAQVSRTLRHSQ